MERSTPVPLLFYHALFLAAYPWLVVRHIPNLLRPRTRQATLEKLGWIRPANAEFWIHAVSGGEALLSKTLVKLLPPIGKIFITTQSHTGYLALEKLYGQDARVSIAYLPYDFRPVLRRYIGSLAPKLLIVIEHDLWPGMLAEAGRMGVRRVLVNAFFKPRDLDFLKRFPWIAPLIYRLDLIFAQNETSAALARRITGEKVPVVTAGNLKILPPEQPTPADLRTARAAIVTFGSSHDGEEEILVNALREELAARKVLVVLIPRHPDRSKKLRESFAKLKTLLWSEKKNAAIPDDTDILIVDAMGVSLAFYQASDIVLIGDTFKPTQGGHNFLEPIFFKKPVIYGMNMISFSDLTEVFERQGAVLRVGPEALRKELRDLIADRERRERMGEKAYALLSGLEFKKELFQKNLLG